MTNGVELQEAGIDAPHGAAVAHGHGGDHVALEPPIERLVRELVHLGRIDPGVDGPGHERQLRGSARLPPSGHHRDGGQRGDAGLTHRDDVGLGAERPRASG